MSRRALFLALCALVVGGVLSALGTIAYLAYVRAMASALIKSAYDIRTKADAEREIAAWKKKVGIFFWTEGDHPGGDHSYDATIANLSIARLHIVEPTGVTVSITMRDGELRSVTVVETVGWYGAASVWIQEWFGEEMPNHFHVGGNRRPYMAHVEFPSSLPEEQRKRAFVVDTGCMVRPRGCKTAEAILPGISQLK